MNGQPDIATRKGKIARLPAGIRKIINEKLDEGFSAKKILPWLNELPEVKEILEREFAGEPVSEQNLSTWRHSGYAEHQAKRDRINRTKELAAYAAEQARANGASIAEGAQAIASGKLLELLETLDEAIEGETPGEKPSPDALVAIAGALGSLRTSEQNDIRLAQNEKRLKQKDAELALAREKFQRETCELFLKWHADKNANDLATADISNADKIERLGQLMFGETWKAQTAPVKK
jgi:Protein of unknown function (DUF3486)